MLRHIYIEIPITWSNSWFGAVGADGDAKSDDFNFVGLIPRLILGCHILSILLSFSFQRRSTYLAYITHKLFLEETA